jgi:hypothetical protein
LIKCEHFIYGLHQRRGIQLYKSKGLTKLVNDDNLQFLCHVGDNAVEETYFQIWLPGDNPVLAVSKVHPAKDEYGRNGVWNHTIVIDINDYVKLTQPHNLFASHFIKALDDSADYSTLQPILIEE